MPQITPARRRCNQGGKEVRGDRLVVEWSLYTFPFTRRGHAVETFLARQASVVQGTLNGFDRVRFRGTQRWLANERRMRSWLWKRQVLLKDFKHRASKVRNTENSAVVRQMSRCRCLLCPARAFHNSVSALVDWTPRSGRNGPGGPFDFSARTQSWKALAVRVYCGLGVGPPEPIRVLAGLKRPVARAVGASERGGGVGAVGITAFVESTGTGFCGAGVTSSPDSIGMMSSMPGLRSFSVRSRWRLALNRVFQDLWLPSSRSAIKLKLSPLTTR